MAKTGEKKIERLIVYVDGFNLYNGLHDAGKNTLLWLDVVKLASFSDHGPRWFK